MALSATVKSFAAHHSKELSFREVKQRSTARAGQAFALVVGKASASGLLAGACTLEPATACEPDVSTDAGSGLRQSIKRFELPLKEVRNVVG